MKESSHNFDQKPTKFCVYVVSMIYLAQGETG